MQNEVDTKRIKKDAQYKYRWGGLVREHRMHQITRWVAAAMRSRRAPDRAPESGARHCPQFFCGLIRSVISRWSTDHRSVILSQFGARCLRWSRVGEFTRKNKYFKQNYFTLFFSINFILIKLLKLLIFLNIKYKGRLECQIAVVQVANRKQSIISGVGL